jgi:ABC-type uncharacterized transport system substrate-binding protein
MTVCSEQKAVSSKDPGNPARKRVIRLALSTLLLTAGFRAEAQQPKKIPRVAWIESNGSRPPQGFVTGLRERGYIEGQSIIIEYRSAQGSYERLSEIAAELVRLRPDVIVADGNDATDAVKKATATIPIVFATHGDPLGRRLVNSLSRPGGNITGLSFLSVELSGKRLELLKDTLPNITRVAILHNPDAETHLRQLKEMQLLSQALAVKLIPLGPRGPGPDFTAEFQSAINQRADALIALPDPVRLDRKVIVDLAAKHGLPAMYPGRRFTEAGGLMSYGPINADLYRRAAFYVDKILKGAKPADLPVEQPTKFELVINLNTAKTLGLTIPSKVLMWADEVIQ